MFFKIIVVVVFFIVVVSLTSGLFFLVKDKGNTKRTVQSLTLRIGLSLFAFGLLMLGHAAGWIQPHGVAPY